MLIKINAIIKDAEYAKKEIETVQNKKIKAAATRARILLSSIANDCKVIRKELLPFIKH